MRKILWYCFLGSKGGETRMEIVRVLRAAPANANQLKVALGVDYSTIRHSLRVLQKNRVLHDDGEKYAARYSLTPEFMSMIQEYDFLLDCHSSEANCTRKKWEKILKEQKSA